LPENQKPVWKVLANKGTNQKEQKDDSIVVTGEIQYYFDLIS
jgi:hypothetical protein